VNFNCPIPRTNASSLATALMASFPGAVANFNLWRVNPADGMAPRDPPERRAPPYLTAPLHMTAAEFQQCIIPTLPIA